MKHASTEKPSIWKRDIGPRLSVTTAEQKHARPFFTLFVVIPAGAAVLTGIALLYAKIKGIY